MKLLLDRQYMFLMPTRWSLIELLSFVVLMMSLARRIATALRRDIRFKKTAHEIKTFLNKTVCSFFPQGVAFACVAPLSGVDDVTSNGFEKRHLLRRQEIEIF